MSPFLAPARNEAAGPPPYDCEINRIDAFVIRVGEYGSRPLSLIDQVFLHLGQTATAFSPPPPPVTGQPCTDSSTVKALPPLPTSPAHVFPGPDGLLEIVAIFAAKWERGLPFFIIHSYFPPFPFFNHFVHYWPPSTTIELFAF